MQKKLTRDLIVMKTKVNQMDKIQRLNLWGMDIDDISIVQQMDDLIVLSLAVNKINTLRDIKGCYKLQELYLRKNIISDLNEIKHLANLGQLKILSLVENPICSSPLYRPFIISQCAQLEKLDDEYVTSTEKEKAN
jgi:Leucine-rich repeat (LRR) protein